MYLVIDRIITAKRNHRSDERNAILLVKLLIFGIFIPKALRGKEYS